MPSLLYEDIKEIFNYAKEFEDTEIFIETGTYKGETTKNMSKIFKKVYTCEYSKKFYNEVDFTEYSNVKKYNNDSETFLSLILPEFKNKKLILFLDAHWAGIDTGFYIKDCPLLEELKIIKKECTSFLLIIDDYNKFGTIKQKKHHKNKEHCLKFGTDGKTENWKDITLKNVLKILDIKDYKIIKNRLIIKHNS